MAWRRQFCAALIEQATAALEGTTEADHARFTQRRQTAVEGLRQAKLKDDLVEVIESIRWYTDDLESDVAERRTKAREELDTLRIRKTELEKNVEESGKKLAELEAGLKTGGEK